MKKILLCAILALTITSCRDEATELMNPTSYGMKSETPLEQFERLWNGINSSYVFWAVDTTDWDAIYAKYRPLFEEVSKKDTISTARLHDLYEGMCGSLIDHHLSIEIQNHWAPADDPDTSVFEISIYSNDLAKRDNFHSVLGLYHLIDGIMKMQENGRMTECKGPIEAETKDGGYMGAYYSIIDNDIAYLYFDSFSWSVLDTEIPNADEREVLKDILDAYHNDLRNRENLRGVIIDLRGNAGGYNCDFTHIVSPLLSEDLVFGYTHTKRGTSRLDYGPMMPMIVSASDEGRVPTCPVVVITDMWTISMGELTCFAVSQMPNGYVIGERTVGAHGSLTSIYETGYNGSFGNLENDGYNVFTSSFCFFDINGVCHEGKGFIPDIEVLYDAEKMKQGIDVQLEKAIEVINR